MRIVNPFDPSERPTFLPGDKVCDMRDKEPSVRWRIISRLAYQDTEIMRLRRVDDPTDEREALARDLVPFLKMVALSKEIPLTGKCPKQVESWGDMSHFKCEHCGAECIDTFDGYVKGCEHYPVSAMGKRLSDPGDAMWIAGTEYWTQEARDALAMGKRLSDDPVVAVMEREQRRLAQIGGRPCEWSSEEWARWSAKDNDDIQPQT